MNISQTYFGFTDNKKPMTAARMEKTLDKQFRYQEGIMSQKSYTYLKLSKGCKPSKEENYSYYSAKLDDYTKPKTLYTIVDKETNTFAEINKTVYDYALYLIDHDFINEEKAQKFMEGEINRKEAEEKAKQAREQKEHEEEERLRQEELARDREERQKKIAEWEEIGKPLMSDEIKRTIVNIIDQNWNTLKNYTQEEKLAFTDQYINTMPQFLGNKSYIDYKIKYYIDNENDPDGYEITLISNPREYIEKAILFSIFSDVKLFDDPRTISAKIRHFYNGTQYSVSEAQNEQRVFYYLNRKTKQFTEAEGQLMTFLGYGFFIQLNDDGTYSVVEGESGMYVITRQKNKQETIKKAKEIIKKNIDKLDMLINNSVKRFGSSPLYQSEQEELVQ
jgi:hypothetical protein